ncbi:putative uncharacterized protein DDB_G0270496 [Phoenix dactylifera]|uniref:Protein AATF-like n=1 Tax=Phoenix dactylifera TaxID=42345 RepID=A0A8B8ZPD5_PHODC|nr:putative uncharacterized protein DDB_G0270496 [Phoenix dactylifera]
MKAASKRVKRVDDDSESGSGAESNPESEMELDPAQLKVDDDDDDGNDDASESFSEGESNQESEMEGEDDGSDAEHTEGQRDAEMDELEKEYLSLRNEEQNLLKSLKRHKDEDALKGQAVKNQKALWDRTLEVRFLLHKAFSSSNRLPQEPIRSLFHNSDAVVTQAYSDLILSSKQTLNCMLELQEALIEQNPSIVQGTDGNSKESCKDEDCSNNLKGEEDEEWLQIHRMHQRIAQFRNNSVDKWQRKTQVTTGAAAFKGKLHAFNQNISEQVAGYMRDPSRMIKRMQIMRSSVGMFGKVPEEFESRKDEDGNVDGDPELLDDSEFYQQLLKEFLESCNLASSETAFYALKRLQPKKRKVVDRRASKSRKIRYNVHEKIVNFMAPVPAVLPPMAPKLFDNLFGMGNQKSATVV